MQISGEELSRLKEQVQRLSIENALSVGTNSKEANVVGYGGQGAVVDEIRDIKVGWWRWDGVGWSVGYC